MPASSKALATPTIETHPPPPPEAITPIRPPLSDPTRRALGGGRTSTGAGFRRSITGKGMSACRAWCRNDTPVLTRPRSSSSFTRSKPRLRL